MSSHGLVAGLLNPSAYAHPVGRIELIETHISWVLLTGESAYKIKKPVNFGFLDFSTLQQRERFCREELRLNRRFAPTLYLDVVPITGTPDAPVVGGAGEAFEFAVRMRQFPQEALLSSMLERGALGAEQIDELACTLAELHARIKAAPAESPFGTPEAVREPVRENFRHLSRCSREQKQILRELEQWSETEFAVRLSSFAARTAGGFIRECHGDLHLGNIVWLDGRPVPFDCVEFNEAFRWIDVLSETAFLVMDLEDRGRAEYAHQALNAWLERSGDYEGVPVLRYYLVYRALVRAKVALLRLEQLEREARAELEGELAGYLDQAVRYTRPERPLLMITHGPSGAGKTTGTQPIVDFCGAIRIRSDVERKRLFGIGPSERPQNDLMEKLYSTEATQGTYARLAECAEAVIDGGFPAVVDATFLERGRRDQFRALSRRLNVPFVVLDFRAADDLLRSRVSHRARDGGDASDATLDVLERQLQSADPLGPDKRKDVLVIESGSPAALERLLQDLTELRRRKPER